MYRDMTRGGITRSLLLFALPMMAGSLLQQLYNVADTLIVGRALGRDALAAVGSAFTLMTFLTSVFLGLAMGAGALFSIYLGRKDMASLHRAAALALCLIGGGGDGAGIRPAGPHPAVFAGARFAVRRHGRLSAYHLCRAGGHVPL